MKLLEQKQTTSRPRHSLCNAEVYSCTRFKMMPNRIIGNRIDGVTSTFCNVDSMSDNLLSIRQAKQLSQRQMIKDWLGRTVTSAMPARAIELYRSPTAKPERFTDKAIMFHLRRRAITENRHGFLARLHKGFWAGEDGATFSTNCDHRFNDLFLARQQADFGVLKTVWDSMKGRNIVEIGTNSGLLLRYLTTNLGTVNRSVGIDINKAQVKLNQTSAEFDSRIKFLCTDGQAWVLENGQPSTLFVTNGGVLEYFRREKLDEMMSHIAQKCAPSIFFCSEPVADDHDFNASTESIPFGEECSFSHNYKDIFESNGFEVLHQRAVQYDSWKMLATIAVTKN